MRYPSPIIVATAVFLIMLGAMSMPLQAEDAATERTSRSISYAATVELDEAAREAELDSAGTDVLPALQTEGFRPESVPSAVYIENIIYVYSSDIFIFDAITALISDLDGDGFYHRFSVDIDADTVYSTAVVYADLYLSYEGGPWNYYASSDPFHIHVDSELDNYIVETELAEGFPPGYYDVRIELFDAETGDLLHIYGPYDDDSLSALPLEDSVYDDPHYTTGVTTEVIVSGHGGLGWLFIAAMLVAGLLRKTANH
jgi:hypothetical protein